MSKKFLFNLILALTVVGISVLWLLSIFQTDAQISKFNLRWAVVIFATVAGFCFIARGLFEKGYSILKKISIFFGAGLLIVSLFAIVDIFAVDNKYVFPIIAVICSVALLLGIVAVGGKKWDAADNQKVGYKNYYQRKEEEERNKKDN
jgi:peptidoglycan/LPS O-acetylase OafA/YrhL